ncbi:MAG TPA: HAD family phosphatase [Methylomirabilota bacterium]|nr:HAD family phosphatase [Methylomirabilota bacterium]
MAEITTLFWDIGGVILTNGWGMESRKQAASVFRLNWDEFQERHEMIFPAFDCGQVTLDEYLDKAVFDRPRDFAREEFTAFMFAQSREYPEVRAVLEETAASGKYFMAAINNEPLELNEFRIEAFHLRRDFSVFFSSCYVGKRKPDPAIYRMALEVTQRAPDQSVFIDDRPINLEQPRQLGMNTVHYQSAGQLRADLARLGVKLGR